MTLNEWYGELLFPGANAEGYRLIYQAETWLRRICHASLLVADGPAWASRLKPELRNRLENESRKNSERWYLGIDTGEELLWSTTHGQLADILRLPVIQSVLHELTGMSGEVLASRLLSVSSVRNALAHNRAISDDSLTILRGDLTVIGAAIDRFRHNTLYAKAEIASLARVPEDLHELVNVFDELAAECPSQQLFLGAGEHFLSVVRLPVAPFDVWPNATKLRKALDLASHLIVCVLVNKAGDEVQVVMPRSLPLDDQIEVLRRFMTTEVLQGAWTQQSPENQHAVSVTWPRMWFYENRTPER